MPGVTARPLDLEAFRGIPEIRERDGELLMLQEVAARIEDCPDGLRGRLDLKRLVVRVDAGAVLAHPDWHRRNAVRRFDADIGERREAVVAHDPDPPPCDPSRSRRGGFDIVDSEAGEAPLHD